MLFRSLREKCAELVGRIKTGQELIVFYDECKRDGKGFKTEVEEQFPFSYETARGYVNLAKNARISALKIDDIMNFKRKSLDGLKDIASLSDVEYELFKNGEFELPKTRKIDKKRQEERERKEEEERKKSLLENEVTETNQNPESEKEFINPFSDLAPDAEVKELLDMNQEKDRKSVV